MPAISTERLKQIRKVEFAINKNLFFICITITFMAMVMAMMEFFSRGAFPPSRIGFFYIGVLFIYSIHKEMLRWLEEKKIERRGEYFVYSWIGFTFLLYLINFLTKGHFGYSPEGIPLDSLSRITATTLEVCGIFILTRLSKLVKISLEKK